MQAELKMGFAAALLLAIVGMALGLAALFQHIMPGADVAVTPGTDSVEMIACGGDVFVFRVPDGRGEVRHRMDWTPLAVMRVEVREEGGQDPHGGATWEGGGITLEPGETITLPPLVIPLGEPEELPAPAAEPADGETM